MKIVQYSYCKQKFNASMGNKQVWHVQKTIPKIKNVQEN